MTVTEPSRLRRAGTQTLPPTAGELSPAPAGQATGTSLHLAGVCRSFGRVRALDRVDLTVPAQTLTAVLGASGCGKTTLLRVIAGFITPDAGTVTVGPTVVAGGGVQVPPERRGVAVVPQEGALFPHLDVAANVGYGLPRRLPGRRDRIAEMLDLVGLTGLGSRRPDELSGGQQQRVAVARALAPSPAVVVFDEPFSALDAGLRSQLRADVRHAMRVIGATGLLVTHDQGEALSVADSVAVMIQGRVAMHATPGEVYHRPTALGVARFVGDLVELPAVKSGNRLDSALGALGTDSDLPDGPVLACLRPEQLLLREIPDVAGSHPGGDQPTAVVADLEFHGHDTLARLQLADRSGADLPVRARLRAHLPVGAEVAVRVQGPALAFPVPG